MIEDKIATNYDRYKRMLHTYTVSTHRVENMDDYDVVVECIGYGYAHKKYRVLKNAPSLNNEDLAIICDNGCLPFGYRCEGGVICVYID